MPAELEPPSPRPPSVDAELDEAIMLALDPAVEGIDASLPDSVQRWQIDNLDSAEWAMRKLARLEARAVAISRQADVWRAPIDQWEQAEQARIEPAALFFAERLRTYAVARRAEDERANKTLRLPSGTVSTRRATEPKVVLTDEEAVIAWAAASLPADEYEAVVQTVQTVRISALRKLVKAVIADPEDGWTYPVVHVTTGEVVPGVTIEMPATKAGPVKPNVP